MQKKIENYAWVLPRPRRSNKYIGGFPQHFEKKLLRLLEIDPEKHKILQPFGGMAEYGIRVDLNPETKPQVLADAHDLNMFEDEIFDLVILDPPYNAEYNERLYGFTKPLRWKQYTKEAVRVLKDGGWLVIYHMLSTPSIKDTVLTKRIFLETRRWHKLRCIHIHRKNKQAWASQEQTT